MSVIGIDNGSTGSIGVIEVGNKCTHILSRFYVRKTTLKSGKGTELSPLTFQAIVLSASPTLVVLERPFTGSGAGTAPVLARGLFDSMRTVLELNGISFIVIDSRAWQKRYLPAGLKGADLKRASAELGAQRWPGLREQIHKQGDADALFLAQYGIDHLKQA